MTSQPTTIPPLTLAERVAAANSEGRARIARAYVRAFGQFPNDEQINDVVAALTLAEPAELAPFYDAARGGYDTVRLVGWVFNDWAPRHFWFREARREQSSSRPGRRWGGRAR
jgi:hypothetical protein